MSIANKYQIEQKYIKKGNARPGTKLVGPKFIVSHETANNTADADNHFSYFNNSQPSASAHTFIDDNKILEIVPLNEKAWHVNYNKPKDNQMFGDDANDSAIGVELCRTGDFKEAYDRYVWYHAYLCRKFNLTPSTKIVQHSILDPQRRSDPESWLKPNGVSWKQFIKDVEEYYNQWEGKVAVKAPEKPKTTPTTKVKGKDTNSIVDYLKSIGESSSYSNREKLAKQYGISNYKGTASQNIELLDKMRKGSKPKAQPKGDMKTTSIVDYLKSIGESSSFSNRKKLAAKYGIKNYTGTAYQNTQLLNKLRG
jgi:N-acetylmuramoyl-L-alanine amidase CwlA